LQYLYLYFFINTSVVSIAVIAIGVIPVVAIVPAVSAIGVIPVVVSIPAVSAIAIILIENVIIRICDYE
jgi:hypothetical protein